MNELDNSLTRSARRAFAMAELAAVLVIVCLLLAMALPAMSAVRSATGLERSMANLRALGAAHVTYSRDFAGRQYTTVPDNFSAYGSNAVDAVAGCQAWPDCNVPPVWIGWGQEGYWYFTPMGAAVFNLYEPIGFLGGNAGFGYFRVDNVEAFHTYVSTKFYGREFYAPDDEHVFSLVEPALDMPSAFHNFAGGGGGSTIYWSSYSRSPAALFDPQVMRAPSQGGWINPWSIDTGLNAPPLNAAKHPDLKTHVIEHNWIQNRPKEPCNPAMQPGSYSGCEPWYFNHGIESTPATLFYDGHVRLLPNAEAQASDVAVLKGSGGVDGLWSRDTPFGANGYFLQAAFDDIVDVSHHVLTTNGILGRDTLGPDTPRGVFEPVRRDRKAAPTPARPSILDPIISLREREAR